MAKRYTGRSRSHSRRARVNEEKFLQKYGYESDQDLMFEKYRIKRSRIGSDVDEYDMSEADGDIFPETDLDVYEGDK